MWLMMSIYEPAIDSEWLLAVEAIQKVPDASKKAAQTLDATASSLPAESSPPNKIPETDLRNQKVKV